MFADESEREKELEQLLTDYYSYLVNHISATDLMPFLVQVRVLTTTDREEVEAKTTSVDRRMKLLDIVMRRGYGAMEEFLQALEYQEPSVFYHLTKREARDPPPEVAQVMHRLSSERRRVSLTSFKKLKDMMSDLDKEVSRTRQNMDKVINNVKAMQEKSVLTHDSLNSDWNEMDMVLEEKRARFTQLSRDHVATLQELVSTRRKYKAMKAERDAYVTRHSEDAASLRTLECSHAQLQARHDALLQENARLREKSRPSSHDVKKLQEQIERLLEVSAHGDKGTSDLKAEVERQKHTIDVLTKTNTAFNTDLLLAVEERQKVLAELQKREKKIDEQKEMIEKLREENATLVQELQELQGWGHSPGILRLRPRVVKQTSCPTPTETDSPGARGGGVFGSCPRSPKSPQP